jgi:hypothetical protein
LQLVYDITLWHDLDDVSVEIKTDENLLHWFQCNIEKGEVGIIAEIKDFERRCHPTVRNRGIEDANPPIVPSKEIHTHKKAIKDDKKVKEKGEHDSEIESDAALSDSSYDSGLAASFDSGSDYEYDPDAEIIKDDYDDVPMFSYDVDDPCIDVAVVFPDVDQCQIAVQYWCIVNDHAYHIIKKDKGRFRANCLRERTGCKWQFFLLQERRLGAR